MVLNFLRLKRMYSTYHWHDYVSDVRSLRTISNTITGRYCGSDLDKLGQAVAVRMVIARRVKGVHVDIGVLFGGSVLLKSTLLDTNDEIIGIDPLSGFYDTAVDPVTNLPVTLLTTQANIAQYPFKQCQNIRLLPFKSSDKQAWLKFKPRSIATLLIDGDHSYQGIKQDWQLYTPKLNLHGIVIIDDYQEAHHPDVTRFINNLKTTPAFQHSWRIMGNIDTTLLIERIR